MNQGGDKNTVISLKIGMILAFGILHLLEDNRQVIQRITELLKPGGLFISSTPCLAEKMTLLTKLQYYPYLLLDKIGLTPSIKRFKISELNDLIAPEYLRLKLKKYTISLLVISM